VTGVSIAALFTGGLLQAWCCDHVVGAGVVALTATRTSATSRARPRRDRQIFCHCPARAGAAVRDPRRRGRGIATATEVSTIGIVYGLVVGLLVYRHFDWRRLMPMLVETACLSGAILLIIGTATGMAWGLTQSGFSRALAGAMTGCPVARDLHCGIDRCVHGVGQRARGHSRDRAVRPATVSDRADGGVTRCIMP